MRLTLFGSALILLTLISNCSSRVSELPMGAMPIPSDNLFSNEKVALGRALFFDKRLSRKNNISCASCHIPKYAFADTSSLSRGVDGGMTMRNVPTLLNVGYQKALMFDARVPTLEQQVIVPIQDHQEMNMRMGDLVMKLRAIPSYSSLSKHVFNRDFDAYVLTRSIAAFERTLVSQNSRFDQFVIGRKSVITSKEKAGYLIFSKKLYCAKCHPYPHFTNYNAENNGLYADFEEDKGRFRIYNDSSDIGKFKVPTLRNIELTSPYMHDGSIKNLGDVIDHYAKGGNHPANQHPAISPFKITSSEKEQLLAFLRSLTDTNYISGFR